MKIQIDTTNRIVRIEEPVKIKEFLNFLKQTLSDWENYTLEMSVIKEFINPIIITNPAPTPYYPNPLTPTIPYTPITDPWWRVPDIICESQSTNISGKYNFEIKS